MMSAVLSQRLHAAPPPHCPAQTQEWSAPSKVPVATRSAASSAGRSAYELAWTCDMELTRSGLRGELVVELAVAEFGVVSVPLMAKVYSHDDSAASHGESGGHAWLHATQRQRRCVRGQTSGVAARRGGRVRVCARRHATPLHQLCIRQERADRRGADVQQHVQQVMRDAQLLLALVRS